MIPKRAKLILSLYLAAVLLWVLAACAGLVRTAVCEAKGECVRKELTLDDFELVSCRTYIDDDHQTGDFIVSTDADPKMICTYEGYVNRVVLKLEHERPGNGVELYYLLPGQTDYRESQLVYAEETPEGWYQFDLKGRYVSSIRIDPDSQGGIISRFEGVELNADWPVWQRFIPSGGWVLLLTVLPLLLAAVVEQLRAWFAPEKTEK